MRHSLSAKKKRGLPWIRALHASYWVGALLAAIWFVWILLNPSSGGNIGEYVSNMLLETLGQSAYLFPFLLFYGLAVLLLQGSGKTTVRKSRRLGVFTLGTGTVLILASISSGLELARTSPQSPFNGGLIGQHLSLLLDRMFGTTGTVLLSMGLLFVGLNVLFEISWASLLKRFLKTLAEDYRAWMTARRDLKNRIKIISVKEVEIVRSSTASRASSEARAGEPETNAPEIVPSSRDHKMLNSETSTFVPTPAIHRHEPDDSAPAMPGMTGTGPEAGKTAFKKVQTPFADFKLPSTRLLNEPPSDGFTGPDNSEVQSAGKRLEETLASFDVTAHVAGVYPGPVITRYEVSPAPGVKVSSIVALSNDIALAMKAPGIRVIAPIPGKAAIGFEIPNSKRATVCLREILESSAFNEKGVQSAPLLFALGQHADGAPAIANLEKMPHLLVAGATNSGKSVFLHSLILSLLYRNTPDEVKFLMMDPKRLELTFYEGIPHLYDPRVPCESVSVITQAKDAARSLLALIKVMERRYAAFERAKVKNIASYNSKARANNEPGEFYIVVVIDELADLILQSKDIVEDSIQRLAQMARAVGIHLVLCTQRPSVNVITGVIKANLPSRIALQVISKTDSRVILDVIGAESLLGKGDMLHLAQDVQKPVRIQGAYACENEIQKVADFVKAQGQPYYPAPVTEANSIGEGEGKGASPEEIRSALKLIIARRRVSQDLLKAHFGSSARATNLLSLLEVRGFIHKPDGSNRWEIFFDKIETQLALMDGNTAEGDDPGAGGSNND